MQKIMTESLKMPSPFATDFLTGIIHQHAQRLLVHAVRLETDQWLAERSDLRDSQGHRLVVGNGYLPQRNVLTGVGPVAIRQPRVEDRRPVAQREKLQRNILPPYLRRTHSINEAIPWMYLYGISTNDMGESLKALLGPSAERLSPGTISRLLAQWQKEYEHWNKRSLAGKEYVYLWADGVYFNVRANDENSICILVLMGATSSGNKEIIAIADGQRESKQSWVALLLDAKSRGFEQPAKLATGDGALGFWAALEEIYPSTQHQRCWVHKTANVLNKLPKSLQPQAKDKLHEIWMAPKRSQASAAFDLFIKTYEAKYPAAVECLRKDRDCLLRFYDFPAEHWPHLRTTNPIESVFATVKLRHAKTRNNASRKACLAMVHQLCMSAQRRFQRLNGPELTQDVLAGVAFEDGQRKQAA